MLRRILLIPGIHDSGPAHWQSRWEYLYPQVRRIRQDNWDAPQCAEWVATIERAVEAETARPILVAHSLGCLAVAHWAAQTRIGSHGLLLVAVPDARSAKFPAAARGFEPLPATLRGARAVIVGSENDPYAAPDFGRKLAQTWGASYVNAGRAGHLNESGNVGDWPEGWTLIERWRCEPGSPYAA
jgi:predicted alpha/beta hydrolase family esterase